MQTIGKVLGFILLLMSAPHAVFAQVTHTVDQVGTSFSPANLTIQEGDTVRWVFSSGIHTVTSGTGASDPDVGLLFDAPLNSASTTFEFQFTTPGTVPYFCRPHEIFNMKGTIQVEAASTPVAPGLKAALDVGGVSPNPFNPRTEVSFTLGQTSAVTISIHDVRGRLVRSLLSGGTLEAGERSVVWDGLDDAGAAASSGVYLFRVQAARAEQVVRGVLVR